MIVQKMEQELSDLREAGRKIATLTAELAAMKAERDAALTLAARYERMRIATMSHVDGRDMLAELKPNAWHFCNIKVQVRRNGEWKEYEGDWLKGLLYARDRDDGAIVDGLQQRVDAAREGK